MVTAIEPFSKLNKRAKIARTNRYGLELELVLERMPARMLVRTSRLEIIPASVMVMMTILSVENLEIT